MTVKRIFLLLFTLFLMRADIAPAQGQNNQELAMQYSSTGEYDKAVVYFERWYNNDPFAAYQPYLQCLVALKDYDKAEKMIKKQLRRVPNNLTLYVDMGMLYSAQEKEGEAKQQFEKAIKELTPDVQQVLSLGSAFVERRKLDYALTTYLEGRKMLEGVYPFNFELADVYAQMNNPQKMVEEYLGLLEFNESYLPNIQAILQNKMAFDLEGGLADVIRNSLLRKVQKGGQKTIYNELLYWLLLQEKDFDSALIQAKALDKRNDETGGRLISLGKLCVTNQEYRVAEECFQYVIAKGRENPNYVSARMELIAARDQKITRTGTYTSQDLLNLDQDYQTTIAELGKTPVTASLVSDYAHLKAFYLDKTEEAIILLEETIAMPRVPPNFLAQCKLELGDILILTGNVWDASLLYSQVDKDFKNDALGREAKFRNARLSYFMGEFEWAAAQLNVLKAATSQLISNDAMSLGLLVMDNMGLDSDSNTAPLLIYSKADLYAFCNRTDSALFLLDSLLVTWPGHSLTDETWFKQAGLKLKQGDYAAAQSLYMKVLETYPSDILADDALYRLADLTENKMNDKEQAKTLYEMLLTKYPGSLYVVDARKRFRALRGDKVSP
jgi:tetratricopeptide (TPR) repeat protein